MRVFLASALIGVLAATVASVIAAGAAGAGEPPRFANGAELLRSCVVMPTPVCAIARPDRYSLDEANCLWGTTTPLTPAQLASVRACAASIRHGLRDWPTAAPMANATKTGLAYLVCPSDTFYPDTSLALDFVRTWRRLDLRKLPTISAEQAVVEAFTLQAPGCVPGPGV